MENLLNAIRGGKRIKEVSGAIDVVRKTFQIRHQNGKTVSRHKMRCK